MDGHLAFFVTAHDGVVFTSLRDVNLGIVFAENKLGQFFALVETHDGIVLFGDLAGVGFGQGDLQTASIGRITAVLAEGDVACTVCVHQNTRAWRNGIVGGFWGEAVAFFVHDIIRHIHISVAGEGVAHQIPTSKRLA